MLSDPCHRCAHVTDQMSQVRKCDRRDVTHVCTCDRRHVTLWHQWQNATYKQIQMHHKNPPMEQVNCIAMHHIKRFASGLSLLVESIESAGCGWLGRSIRRQRTLTLSKNPLQLKSLHIDSISECFFISNRSLSLETHLVCCGHYWCQMHVCCVLCVPFSGKRHRQPHLKRGPL